MFGFSFRTLVFNRVKIIIFILFIFIFNVVNSVCLKGIICLGKLLERRVGWERIWVSRAPRYRAEVSWVSVWKASLGKLLERRVGWERIWIFLSAEIPHWSSRVSVWKASLGKLLERRVGWERIWVFPSAEIPCWSELSWSEATVAWNENRGSALRNYGTPTYSGQGHGEGHLPPGELTSNEKKSLLERFYYVKLCLECGSLKNMRQLYVPLYYWSMPMIFFFFFFLSLSASCFRLI